MFDVHSGAKAELSTVIKTGRIMLELLEQEHFDSFYVGFCDRVAEELDRTLYRKVDRLNTIREVFYLIGYTIADREIFFSEKVKKNPPSLEDFKQTMCNYLDRFNILNFYERNSQATLQMLP